MGMHASKSEGLLTPVELVIRQHPDYAKQIRNCMKKWNTRTSGTYRWPIKGAFEITCCANVEANIRHYKAKDTSNSREGKRAREREVLRWFKDTAKMHLISGVQMPALTEKMQPEPVTPTAPEEAAPPPYSPQMTTPAGIYPMMTGETRGGGEVTGQFTINCNPTAKEPVSEETDTDDQSSTTRSLSERSERANKTLESFNPEELITFDQWEAGDGETNERTKLEPSQQQSTPTRGLKEGGYTPTAMPSNQSPTSQMTKPHSTPLWEIPALRRQIQEWDSTTRRTSEETLRDGRERKQMTRQVKDGPHQSQLQFQNWGASPKQRAQKKLYEKREKQCIQGRNWKTRVET